MAASLISVDVLARLFELSPRRIQQLADDGVIPRVERGRYELVGAVRGYIKHLREKAFAGDLGADAYSTQRARLTKARADMAELEQRQLAKELIPADDIEAAWSAVTLALRARLLSIPTKAVPRLLAAKDAVQISEILRDQISEALDDLANVRVEVTTPVRTPDAGASDDLGDEAFAAAAEADD
jgi:phage terminase Nu1 subunit (DNA packaging protein)